MADTRLSPSDLARIDRDLDQLVMPSPETVRALVAETRRLEGPLSVLNVRHIALAAAAFNASADLQTAIEEAAK